MQEPVKCSYLVEMETPLVCGDDDSIMAVYPRLSPALQQRWDQLYSEHKAGLLTDLGYEKYLQEVFMSAGLVHVENEKVRVRSFFAVLGSFTRIMTSVCFFFFLMCSCYSHVVVNLSHVMFYSLEFQLSFNSINSLMYKFSRSC